MQIKKKFGFTLAEVLITLGLLGIVASMTIPSLMMGYQKKVWATTLKKEYSVLVSACERMVAGENARNIRETEFYRTINKEASTTANLNRIVDRYIKYVNAQKGKSSSAYKYLNSDTAFTVGGEQVYFMTLPAGTEVYINGNMEYTLDLNGLSKGPNKIGNDVFSFKLSDNCSYVASGTVGACTSATADETAPFNCFNNVMNSNWEIRY